MIVTPHFAHPLSSLSSFLLFLCFPFFSPNISSSPLPIIPLRSWSRLFLPSRVIFLFLSSPFQTFLSAEEISLIPRRLFHPFNLSLDIFPLQVPPPEITPPIPPTPKIASPSRQLPVSLSSRQDLSLAPPRNFWSPCFRCRPGTGEAWIDLGSGHRRPHR